jgi:hypothetical protein
VEELRADSSGTSVAKATPVRLLYGTAEAVPLTTPASEAGRGPRSKAFAPSVRNGCATRNGRTELSTIRPVSGRAQRDVVLKGTAFSRAVQSLEGDAALAAEGLHLVS